MDIEEIRKQILGNGCDCCEKQINSVRQMVRA
jgi:hypothetical protein